MTVRMDTLDHLRVGQSARIRAIYLPEEMQIRMRDLGLIPGTVVHCMLKSPLGSPAAYEVRGAVLALRRSDARQIQIEVSL